MTRAGPARPARLLAVVLCGALLAGACSGDDGGRDGGVTDAGGGGDRAAALASIADDVIVPSYAALVADLDTLVTQLDALCGGLDPGALEPARAAWRDTALAYAGTRAGDAGPASDRRLEGSLGFRARPESVDALLASDTPLDPASLAEQGAAVRGLSALELALFGAGSDALGTDVGARRCTYATSVAELSRSASAEVLADWGDGYRDTFVEGMDGDPTMSLAEVLNSVTFRLQEVDDQGLRSFVEVGSYDELPPNRQEGPAAYGMAAFRGLLGSIAAVLGVAEGDRIVELVREQDGEAATTLQSLVEETVAQLAALPDSIAASFADPAALAAAAEVVGELKVLVGSQIATLLGVTIGFSDADGDS